MSVISIQESVLPVDAAILLSYRHTLKNWPIMVLQVIHLREQEDASFHVGFDAAHT